MKHNVEGVSGTEVTSPNIVNWKSDKTESQCGKETEAATERTQCQEPTLKKILQSWLKQER